MAAKSSKQITILRRKAANCKRHSQCIPCLGVLLALILFLGHPLSTMAQSGQFGDFTYSSDGVSVTITGYSGSGGAITIPSLITNLPVTSIGTNAFYNRSGLTSVTIGNSVTNIGDSAFSYCTNLTSVYFQGNAPFLGPSVFTGDSKATVYYLAGTTGWGTTFGGRPTAVWVALSVNHVGPKIVLTWSGGVLLESTNLANGGTWTTNASATSPFTNTPSPNAPMKFYRAKAN